MSADSENFNDLSHALDHFKGESSKLLEECRKQFQELYTTHSKTIDELESKAAELQNILISCQKSESEINSIVEKSSKEIDEYLEDAKTQAEAAEEAKVKSSSIYTELKTYGDKIFGYINIDKKEINQREFSQIDDPDNRIAENGKYYEIIREKIPGIKDEIAQLVEEYKGFIKTDKEETAQRNESITNEFDNLYKRIESLLPGATAAGLSESYYQSEKSSLNKVYLWMVIFGISLVGFIVTGWIMFSMEIIRFPENPSLGATLSQIARALFFESPFIWLGVTANVKMSQYTRLNEEYRHKWTMMRVFDGMRTVLNDEAIIDKEGSNIDFYRTLLAMFEENPSRLLDKKYTPDSPLTLFSHLRPNNDKDNTEHETNTK